MQVKVGNFEFTEVWDGVFYKKLSHFPQISDWEIRNIIEFTEYEKMYGRECDITCENTELLKVINNAISHKENYIYTARPKLITECTACPIRKGCETEWVCHTTGIESAEKILQSGKLLSALKARKLPVEQLMKEDRNAAKDPADYFEYVMFAWGNCQAGDRLVMERSLNRFPNEVDLGSGFMPGIRFYFRYEEIIRHPNAVFDGVLPVKVKDEVDLDQWVSAIVIPIIYKERLLKLIPKYLLDRVLFIENDCKDIWEWSEKVYTAVEKDPALCVLSYYKGIKG